RIVRERIPQLTVPAADTARACKRWSCAQELFNAAHPLTAMQLVHEAQHVWLKCHHHNEALGAWWWYLSGACPDLICWCHAPNKYPCPRSGGYELVSLHERRAPQARPRTQA